MSNTTAASISDSVLQDLNLLIPPGDAAAVAAAQDAFHQDALAPFTDTLFYDWDLGRFLDGVESYRPDEQQREQSLENSSTSKDYAPTDTAGLGRESADFFAGARDPLLSQALSAMGYDFLNFKFPEQHASGTGDGETQPYHSHHRSSTSLSVVAGALTIDPALSVQSLDDSVSPHTALTTAMMSPPRDSSPTTPRSHLQGFTFPPASDEHSLSGSSTGASSPLPSHRLGSISESDAHILSIQEAARQAAEEDKRRRNTAASARFRIKKKQRDQAIEKAAKDMTDRLADLEKKISQLELENRWLRNLLVEKNSAQVDALSTRRGL